jgi:heterodisulfide reductase subunit A-like polyferredoxin
MVNALDYRSGLAPSGFRAVVLRERCTGCGTCKDRCAFGCINLDLVASVERARCFGCGSCVLACPEGALSLEPLGGPPGLQL